MSLFYGLPDVLLILIAIAAIIAVVIIIFVMINRIRENRIREIIKNKPAPKTLTESQLSDVLDIVLDEELSYPGLLETYLAYFKDDIEFYEGGDEDIVMGLIDLGDNLRFLKTPHIDSFIRLEMWDTIESLLDRNFSLDAAQERVVANRAPARIVLKLERRRAA